MAGEDFHVQFSVENLAFVRTTIDGEVLTDAAQPPPVEIRFYLSADPDITTSDVLLGTRRVAAAELQTSLSQSLTLPSAGNSIWNGNGTYFVGMIADPANEFAETVEGNNRNRGDSIDLDAIEVSGTVPLPPQFALTTVADTTMQAPAGNLPFTGFATPVISEGIVSFVAATSAGEGLYQFNAGSLSTVADTSTPAPGGNGNIRGFSFFGNDFLASDQQHVAFYASDQSLDPGIYSKRGSGALTLVANESTDIPGGAGKFANVTNPAVDGEAVVFVGATDDFKTGLYQRTPSGLTTLIPAGTQLPGGGGLFDEITNPMVDEGIIAFRGFSNMASQEGIYLRDANGIRTIADRSTAVPGRSGNFGSFAAPGQLALEGGDVAFVATDSTFAQGVYVYAGGSLRKVADTNDAIPNGTGKFTSFTSVSLHGGIVAFHGVGNDGQQGIYVNDQGSLLPVVTAGQAIDGRTVDFMNLHNEGMDGNWLAFTVDFTNGDQGIVRGRRLRPAVNMSSFTSTQSNVIGISYTIVDGPLPGFDIKFFQSPTPAFNTAATLLDTITVSDPNRLTSGNHTLTFTIGAGANQVSLPGAGAALANADHYLVATADTSSVPFHGLYHVTGGPVVLHGKPGGDQVKVKQGSVQIDWDGEVFTFDSADVTGVYVLTHDGNDTVDLSDTDQSVRAFAGGGNDVLIAGNSTQHLEGGDNDDRYQIARGSTLTLVDPAGQDQLDFQFASTGISLDLDLQAVHQTLATGLGLGLVGQFEDLMGTSHPDTVWLNSLTTASRTIQLGGATGGRNVVQFDAMNSAAIREGQQIQVAGHEPITLVDVQSFIYTALTGWHRPMQREDVTNDGSVVPLDVLAIINELNVPRFSDPNTKELAEERPAGAHFFDVNNDGFITSLDALVVINLLNSQASGGEGESAWHTAIPQQTRSPGSGEVAAGSPAPTNGASIRTSAIDAYFNVPDQETRAESGLVDQGSNEWEELIELFSCGIE